MAHVRRNGKVYIHTSYLPYLPYEPNTYVIFENLEVAFQTLYEMYEKHAAYTEEAQKLATAYRILQYQCNSLSNVQFMCDILQSICIK